MREYNEIRKELVELNKKQKELIAELKQNGMSCEETNITVDNDILVTFPHTETGSSMISVTTYKNWYEQNKCWNGTAQLMIYNKESNFFQEHLKHFFERISVDSFNKKQNQDMLQEIKHWIDSLPDELYKVFAKTLYETHAEYREFYNRTRQHNTYLN